MPLARSLFLGLGGRFTSPTLLQHPSYAALHTCKGRSGTDRLSEASDFVACWKFRNSGVIRDMQSTFLEVDGIRTEEEAIQWSINAAVQRNRVYRSFDRRQEFRADWKRIIRNESRRYRSLCESLSDSQHCGIIRVISDHLSTAFAASLNNGRLRYGTSQKAFNVYLKYLWHLGEISPPPHCPVDRIVLNALRIAEAWTK